MQRDAETIFPASNIKFVEVCHFYDQHISCTYPSTLVLQRHYPCWWGYCLVSHPEQKAMSTVIDWYHFLPCNFLKAMQEALRSECRVDGRNLYQTRAITFDFLPDDTGVTIALGDTRVQAAISAELEEPRMFSVDGRLLIDVHFSAMASKAFGGFVRPAFPTISL
jgi:hypothetical protein